jgi:hypothetical protein
VVRLEDDDDAADAVLGTRLAHGSPKGHGGPKAAGWVR